MTRHTDELKHQIERILQWEESSHWRLRDFERLSTLIFAHVHRRLDANTLQVFWRQSVVRSPDFLDILAQYADYEDWDDFCKRNFYGRIETDAELLSLRAPIWEIPARWISIIGWVSIIASTLVGILLVWKR